jgi:hypothetical protein
MAGRNDSGLWLAKEEVIQSREHVVLLENVSFV